MGKRYYWIKLQQNFFRDKKIKKLRRMAGGDTLTIIYLELQLLTLNTDGVYVFEGVENDIYEELALELDEEIENVKMLLYYLKANGMIEINENSDVAIPYVIEHLGSETASAKRVREYRKRKEKEDLALQCNTNVQIGNVEKERELEKELEKEKNSVYYHVQDIYDFWNSKEIIKHRELTPSMSKAIEKALKEFSKDEILQYINRYDSVIKDESYLFKHRWTIEEFMKRKNAIYDFKDDGSKWVNYKNKETQVIQHKPKGEFASFNDVTDWNYEE